MLEPTTIAAGFGVVEFIDHDDSERLLGDRVQGLPLQSLNADEEVTAFGACLAHPGATEATVSQGFAICAQRLFEDLPSMRDEQQARSVAGSLAEASVVQGGNHGLAGAGGGNDQVSVVTLFFSRELKAVEDLPLKLVGADFEAGELEACVNTSRSRVLQRLFDVGSIVIAARVGDG